MEDKKPNTTDDLISVLKQNIENDKNMAMQAVIGRIPLLCQSVLNIHEMQKEIKGDLEKLAENLEKKYVTKEALSPIKALVYGCVGMVLASVVGAVIALVIIHK